VKDLKWPAVAVIGILVVTLGVLSYFDKDATMVLTSVMAVLTALGFGYTLNRQSELQNSQTEIKSNTETIKEQTNGNVTAFMTMLDRQNQDHRRDMKELARALATMTPPEHGTMFADKGPDHPSDL
jgi:hypothetical protein